MKCCLVLPENKVCPEEATFEIRDTGDNDPYASVTQACDDHVGLLCGHRVELPDDVENRWEVRALESE